MGSRPFRRVSVAVLLAACSTALGVDHVTTPPPASTELLQMYPGSRVLHDQGRIRTFYGVPMTAGLTPQDAASLFIQLHGEAFGAGQLSLEPLWATPVMDGRFTAFGFRQTIDGLPVEYGNLRILVLNGQVPRVVYAAGTLADRPAGMPGEANQAQFPSATALRLAQAQPSARAMRFNSWTTPKLLVWQGEGPFVQSVRTWKVIGYSANPSHARAYYINADTGKLEADIKASTETDVNGNVQAFATPGTRADSPLNPPVLMDVPQVKVSITGGGFAYADRNGDYTIAHPGTSPVTVNTGSSVASGFGGMWVNVVPANGVTGPLTDPLLASTPNVTPPGPGDLLLNPVPAERLTAQANLLICVDTTHNYFKDRAPSFNALDFAIVANAGVNGTCNANFNPGNLTINFFNAGGNCNNTAFSSVISHEYGHFIVDRLNLAQGGFGEGYGDVTAMMIWDDNIMGRDFRTSGQTFVRDPIAANIQFPCSSSCSGAVHCCGQLLSASWWRIRENFGTQYGSTPGLDMTRTREVAWSLITIGGTSPSAMSGTNGEITAVEILTVDDDDGNTANGTPNRNLICPALAQGSVICPTLALVNFTYPNGRPATLTPGQPTPFSVHVTGVAATPAPGTGTLSYRVNGGSFSTISMAQGNPNQYTATIPAANCGDIVDYYVSAQAQGGGSQTDPSTAPLSTFNVISASSQSVVADHNFNTDPAWTRTLNGTGTMTTGQWDRGTPISATGAPGVDFDGSGQCWVTDNRAGNFDLDGGPTTLTTTPYNLSGFGLATVSFARWFTTVNGVTDSMTFQYSTNGTTWNTLQSTGNTVGWQLQSINLPPAALTPTTQFRWNISDQPNDSVTEGGVDAFKLVGYSCSAACYADCDGIGGLTANDFACFLTAYSAGLSYANCDGVGGLTANDFSCFLNVFAAGCS
jgi:hypothetical protein